MPATRLHSSRRGRAFGSSGLSVFLARYQLQALVRRAQGAVGLYRLLAAGQSPGVGADLRLPRGVPGIRAGKAQVGDGVSAWNRSSVL